MAVRSGGDDAAIRPLLQIDPSAQRSARHLYAVPPADTMSLEAPPAQREWPSTPVDGERFRADKAAWHQAMRGYFEAARAFHTRGSATARQRALMHHGSSPSPVTHQSEPIPQSQSVPPQSESLPQNPLTPRQLEVAALIARGYTNAEIAVALTITTGTAGNHVQQILRRLQCRSRTQVAMWLVQQRLLPGVEVGT